MTTGMLLGLAALTLALLLIAARRASPARANRKANRDDTAWIATDTGGDRDDRGDDGGGGNDTGGDGGGESGGGD